MFTNRRLSYRSASLFPDEMQENEGQLKLDDDKVSPYDGPLTKYPKPLTPNNKDQRIKLLKSEIERVKNRSRARRYSNVDDIHSPHDDDDIDLSDSDDAKGSNAD